MLKRVGRKPALSKGATFAVVAAQYNARYVDALLRTTRRELRHGGGSLVKVVRVPGAFEIPVVAGALARSHLPRLSAVICMGVIFQGETAHARQIGDSVTGVLAQLQVSASMPIIDGVYLFDNEQQAKVRCLGRTHNRGVELAQTALSMAKVMRGL